jgi:hypothetical protein
MSMYPTYCKCSDGFLYKHPMWRSELKNGLYSWFICLDDEELPELVWLKGQPQPELSWFKPVSRTRWNVSRCFSNDMKMLKASSVFGELAACPPPPEEFDGRFTNENRPHGDCIVYDFDLAEAYKKSSGRDKGRLEVKSIQHLLGKSK